MSFSRVALYPANPTTVRGAYTKLSASKEKIVYTNGKTVFVSASSPSPVILSNNVETFCPQIRDIAVGASFSIYITLLLIVRGEITHKKNPGLGITYSGHVQNTTVARVSPTGYYCASADASGTGTHCYLFFLLS
jgi:WD repeat-containing protein 1 (actin-interacting protein 1)